MCDWGLPLWGKVGLGARHAGPCPLLLLNCDILTDKYKTSHYRSCWVVEMIDLKVPGHCWYPKCFLFVISFMCVYENSTSFFSSYSYLRLFLTLKQSQRLKHFLKSEGTKKTVGLRLQQGSRVRPVPVTLHTEILFLGLKVMVLTVSSWLEAVSPVWSWQVFNWSTGEMFMFNPVGQTRFFQRSAGFV